MRCSACVPQCHVYMTDDSRINIAGLRDDNIEYFAQLRGARPELMAELSAAAAQLLRRLDSLAATSQRISPRPSSARGCQPAICGPLAAGGIFPAVDSGSRRRPGAVAGRCAADLRGRGGASMARWAGR